MVKMLTLRSSCGTRKMQKTAQSSSDTGPRIMAAGALLWFDFGVAAYVPVLADAVEAPMNVPKWRMNQLKGTKKLNQLLMWGGG